MPIMVRGTDGEMKEISDRVSWIVHCPPGDQNFKDCLGEATADEIEEALDIMGCMEQKKTAIAACERELRKKRKEIRDAHEERKESLIAGFYPQVLFDELDGNDPDFKALLYMTARVANALGREDDICERYGWKVPDDLGWSEGLQYFVQQLATLTTAELLRVIYFVMLKQTRHDDVIFEAVYGEGETGEH